MELTTTQVILIGLVATILAQGVKLAGAYLHWDIGKGAITVIAYIISAVFAFFIMKPATPDGGWTFLAIMDMIINQAGAVMGLATTIYNILFDKILTALGWTKDRVLLMRG